MSDWRDRAEAVIPGGASTGSKRAEALYGAGGDGPTHFTAASGCTLVSADGEELVDCTMALGSVAIGYADDVITQHVIAAASAGTVAGLSSTLEVEVAERLCDLIPCAEQVRFLKSGAEAVSAAVRLARAATGRSTVVACGYFGWHDWSSDSAGVPAGVPAGARADVVRVPFDDDEALRRAVSAAGSDLAAIVLEPVIERLPSDAWIRSARALCDSTGAVLVFDELKTGFRLRTGGFQELSGVEPDLATFGKAMANGYPLAAVVGRAAIMDAARERTWISSTLAGETIALAAASGVLDWHERAEVCESLAEIGGEMRRAVEGAVRSSGIGGVEVAGLDQMWLLRFDTPERETDFLRRALGHGVLFKRGAYNFAALAHDDDALFAIERAASTALVEMREGGDR